MIIQTLRRRQPFAWLIIEVLAILMALFLVFLGIVWWMNEGRHSPTCMKARPGVMMIPEMRGFVELSLKEQDPIEPTVESDLYLRLEKPPVSPPQKITVKRSAVGIYAQSTTTFPLQRDGSAADAPLQSPGWQKLGLVSQTGLHRNFPFDSQSFEFTLDFDTGLPLDVVRLTNRIAGFYIPCDEITVNWDSPSALPIRFDLKRNRLIQLFAIVFVVVAAVFAVIIISLVKDTQALATSVASYFLSLWSLERIVQGQMRTFPTIFDGIIMFLSILMLMLLTVRVIASRFQQMRNTATRPHRAYTLIERKSQSEGGPAASDYPPYK